MKNSKIIDSLDKLTLETDMLTEVLDDALKQHYEQEGVWAIGYLSGKIRKNFAK